MTEEQKAREARAQAFAERHGKLDPDDLCQALGFQNDIAAYLKGAEDERDAQLSPVIQPFEGVVPQHEYAALAEKVHVLREALRDICDQTSEEYSAQVAIEALRAVGEEAK